MSTGSNVKSLHIKEDHTIDISAKGGTPSCLTPTPFLSFESLTLGSRRPETSTSGTRSTSLKAETNTESVYLRHRRSDWSHDYSRLISVPFG